MSHSSHAHWTNETLTSLKKLIINENQWLVFMSEVELGILFVKVGPAQWTPTSFGRETLKPSY
jgi:hypothetical protein